jgi:AcrR family transcriptional regulator
MAREKTASSRKVAFPPEAKKRRSRRHSPVETRADLLRASAKCFAAVGYGRTQVSDVTQEANVAVGTFYVHFTDKEEALLTVLNNHFQPLQTKLRHSGDTSDTAPAAQLRKILSVLIDHSVSDSDGFQVWYRHGHDVSDNADELIRTHMLMMERVVAEALGAASPVDSKTRALLAQGTVGMALSLINRHLLTGEPSQQDVMRISVLSALGGAATSGSNPTPADVKQLLQAVRALAA